MGGTALRAMRLHGLALGFMLLLVAGCAQPLRRESRPGGLLDREASRTAAELAPASATPHPAATFTPEVITSTPIPPTPESTSSPSGAQTIGPTPSAAPEPTASLVQPSSTPRLPASTLTPAESKAPTPTLAAPTQPIATPEPARYVFPIQPPAGVTYGTCHHDYPASDLFAPAGSRFVAVTTGVVDYVSYEDVWDPATDDPATRGGISVALVGDDGVRYYGSHLSAVADGIAVGVRVGAGELLGLTGNTGSARPTDPHLHFGISHPTQPDDWALRRGEINPYPYLNAWREGVNRTPDLAQVGGGAC